MTLSLEIAGIIQDFTREPRRISTIIFAALMTVLAAAGWTLWLLDRADPVGDRRAALDAARRRAEQRIRVAEATARADMLSTLRDQVEDCPE